MMYSEISEIALNLHKEKKKKPLKFKCTIKVVFNLGEKGSP